MHVIECRAPCSFFVALMHVDFIPGYLPSICITLPPYSHTDEGGGGVTSLGFVTCDRYHAISGSATIVYTRWLPDHALGIWLNIVHAVSIQCLAIRSLNENQN
jgi:hypothetical protein